MTVSYYKYSSWLKCPFSFKLKYLEKKFKEEPKRFFAGSLVHDLVETWYGEKCPELSWFMDSFDTRYTRMMTEKGIKWASIDEEKDYINKTKRFVKSFMNIAMDNVFLWQEGCKVEQDFKTTYEGMDITGRMDLVVPYGESGLVSILDLKCYSSDEFLNYDQLYFYEAFSGCKVKNLGYIDLYSKSLLWADLTKLEEKNKEIKDNVRAMYRNMQEDKFNKKVSFMNCNMCDSKEFCEGSYAKIKESLTEGEVAL